MHFQNKCPNYLPFQQTSDFEDEVIVIVSYFSLPPHLFCLVFCFFFWPQGNLPETYFSPFVLQPLSISALLAIWNLCAVNSQSSLLQRGFKCRLVKLQANRDAIIIPTKTFHVQRPYVPRLFKYRMWTTIVFSVFKHIIRIQSLSHFLK